VGARALGEMDWRAEPAKPSLGSRADVMQLAIDHLLG
jgi:hypothetical protein